jgi:hypothetical protein
MGNFKIEINAVGGHGCKREVKDGEKNYGCGQMTCPDCQARAFVAQLQRNGISVQSAELTHWPGEESQVADNLVTLERTGSF